VNEDFEGKRNAKNLCKRVKCKVYFVILQRVQPNLGNQIHFLVIFFLCSFDRFYHPNHSLKAVQSTTIAPYCQRVYFQQNKTINNLLKTLPKIILHFWWGIVGNCVILKQIRYIGCRIHQKHLRKSAPQAPARHILP
ncbi:MAG: hypothetical protein IKB11_03115, partial [Bacteroidaceae bacterium]|nr:hypothetical protein [Bacteroidaceae bacterium]